MSGPLDSAKVPTASVVGGTYNATPPAPVDGQSLSLQQDAQGNLLVNVAVGGGGGSSNVNIADVKGSPPALTNPLPVELSDGTQALGVPGNPISITGSISATNPSVGTTGAAAPTSATEIGIIVGGNLEGVSSANPVPVVGTLTNNNAAPAATEVGVLPAIANAANPTWVEGNQVLSSVDLSGNQRVKVNAPLPAGTNVIGHVIVDSGSTTSSVTGTLTNNNASPAATEIGVLPAVANAAAPTWTEGDQVLESVDLKGNQRVILNAETSKVIGTVNQGTSPWVVSGAVTSSGTATVIGTLTNNNAAPAATEIGVLPALANAANPTWNEGDQVLLSEDLSGNLRVKVNAPLPAGTNVIGHVIADSGSTTVVTGNVNVVGTTTDGTTTETPFLVIGGESNDATAQYQPVPLGTAGRSVIIEGVAGGTAVTVSGTVTSSGNTTVVGTLTNNNAAPSTTNVGVLPGLANAAPPTWNEGDQVLLSEDLAGNLRVIDIAGEASLATIATDVGILPTGIQFIQSVASSAGTGISTLAKVFASPVTKNNVLLLMAMEAGAAIPTWAKSAGTATVQTLGVIKSSATAPGFSLQAFLVTVTGTLTMTATSGGATSTDMAAYAVEIQGVIPAQIMTTSIPWWDAIIVSQGTATNVPLTPFYTETIGELPFLFIGVGSAATITNASLGDPVLANTQSTATTGGSGNLQLFSAGRPANAAPYIKMGELSPTISFSGSTLYTIVYISIRPYMLPIAGSVTSNLNRVGGTLVTTAAAGVQQVGIVGNAGATLDQAQGSAVPTNGLLVGGGSVAGATNFEALTVKAASTAAAATDTSLVVQALIGSAVMSTAAAGVQKVGIVGNAGATLDQAQGSAVPTNGLMVGGGSVAGATNFEALTVKAASVAAAATDTSLVVQPLVGSHVMNTAAAGTQLVGITGSAAAVLDAVTTAATTPANGLATLVANVTTPPSLTTGQSVAAQCDYVGSQFVKPYRRSQTTSQATTIASSAAAANILPVGGTGIFVDLASLVMTVTPVAVATLAIFFTASLKDGTNTYIYDMYTGENQSATIAGSDGTVLELFFNPPLPAAATATQWSITLSVATVTVHITAIGVLQKAG